MIWTVLSVIRAVYSSCWFGGSSFKKQFLLFVWIYLSLSSFYLLLHLYNLADSAFVLRLGKCSHRLEVGQDMSETDCAAYSVLCLWQKAEGVLWLPQPLSRITSSLQDGTWSQWWVTIAQLVFLSFFTQDFFHCILSSMLLCIPQPSPGSSSCTDHAFLFPASLGLRNTALRHQLCFSFLWMVVYSKRDRWWGTNIYVVSDTVLIFLPGSFNQADKKTSSYILLLHLLSE